MGAAIGGLWYRTDGDFILYDKMIWVDKYRPTEFDEYVWVSEDHREKAEEWIEKGHLPHLLLCGRAGSGKTTLAKMLLHRMGIPPEDILFVEASRENRLVSKLEELVTRFTETYASNDTGIKYVLLDEADSLSHLSQRFLRSEMELENVRFILTCNYDNKIIEPLHSRLHVIRFLSLPKESFIMRLGEILVSEEINFEFDDLMGYVDSYYPDMRKCIGSLEQGTIGNTLRPLNKDSVTSGGDADYLIEAYALFKCGKFTEGRKVIISNAPVEEYVSIFRWFYSNIDLWDTPEEQDKALLIIRDALVNHSMVADPEINIAAMLVELSRI